MITIHPADRSSGNGGSLAWTNNTLSAILPVLTLLRPTRFVWVPMQAVKLNYDNLSGSINSDRVYMCWLHAHLCTARRRIAPQQRVVRNDIGRNALCHGRELLGSHFGHVCCTACILPSSFRTYKRPCSKLMAAIAPHLGHPGDRQSDRQT